MTTTNDEIEETTKIIAGIWRDLFAGDIGTEDDFFKLGGDSVLATILMVHIEERFGVILDPIEIFQTPLLSEFAGVVVAAIPQADGAMESIFL